MLFDEPHRDVLQFPGLYYTTRMQSELPQLILLRMVSYLLIADYRPEKVSIPRSGRYPAAPSSLSDGATWLEMREGYGRDFCSTILLFYSLQTRLQNSHYRFNSLIECVMF